MTRPNPENIVQMVAYLADHIDRVTAAKNSGLRAAGRELFATLRDEALDVQTKEAAEKGLEILNGGGCAGMVGK